MAHIQQTTIARLLGVSQATVSRALRGDKRVRAETRESIEREARRLGYRPDPLCAALARHSHRNDLLGERPSLAVVTLTEGTIERGRITDFKEFDHLVSVATERGFTLETVYLGNGTQETQRTLDRLRRRAVRGLFLYDVRGPSRPIEANLDDFDIVNLYPENTDARFPCLSFNHFAEMERVLAELALRDYRRPGLWLGPRHDKVRGWNPWRAAFLLLGPPVFAAARMDGGSLSELESWIRREGIDCLVTFGTEAQQAEWAAAGFRLPPEVGLCGLDVSPSAKDTGVTGIHQPRRQIVEHAVWLMETLLHQRLSGRLQQPAHILMTGGWQEGATLRKAASNRR